MQELDYVCDFMQAIGLKTEETCGGHIHIGVDYLGANLGAWENFLSIWNETEELLYKMSNKEGEPLRKRCTKKCFKTIRKYEYVTI